MNRQRAHASQGRPRLAHAAWAAVGTMVCLLLVLTGQKGHPPAVIFLPHALVVWAVGHGLIWGVHRLAAKGRRIGIQTATASQSWPVGLRLAVVSTGAAALVGVAQVIGTVLEGRWYPYHYAGEWAAMMVVSLVHAACFAGLLRRRRWSRLLSATLALGWAALLGAQIAEHLAPNASSDTTGLLIAAGLMALLLLFGCYLAWSRRARSFLVH